MEDSKKLMLKRIWNFASQYHDYMPVNDSKKHNTVGFYNAFYHDDGIYGIVNKYRKRDNVAIPIVIIGYEAVDDGSVYVISITFKRIKLSKCDMQSINFIYNQITEKREEI